MKVSITEIMPRGQNKYPYTHRVEVSADAFAADKITTWLRDTNIPHTQAGWRIYYLRKEHVEWLVLRWS